MNKNHSYNIIYDNIKNEIINIPQNQFTTIDINYILKKLKNIIITVDNKNAVKDCKMKTAHEELCSGLPTEFVDYFNYVKKLGFTDTPDYTYLYNLFRSIIEKNKFS